jgi:cysteine-rich repeat protein
MAQPFRFRALGVSAITIALLGAGSLAQSEELSNARGISEGKVELIFDSTTLESFGVNVIVQASQAGSIDQLAETDTPAIPLDPNSRFTLDFDRAASPHGETPAHTADMEPDSAVVKSVQLQLRGGILLTTNKHRVALVDPILGRTADGTWILGESPTIPDELRTSEPMFLLETVDIAYRPTTQRFRVQATLLISPALADALHRPELTGALIGRLDLIGVLTDGPVTQTPTWPGNPGPAPGDSTFTAGAIGPDVIVADLYSILNYGVEGSIAAVSVGTTSCNIGDLPATWVANTNQHPVIAQNMFRLKDGRFEQIGMSWLKHGFFAVNGTACFPNCQGTDGSALGVRCSDPYSASLNGAQSNLGPRYQVNANTGYFPYPPANPSYTGIVARRLQVHINDLDTTLNPGALYYIEGHYVTPDEPAWRNSDNNASYKRASVSGAGTSVSVALSGSTFREAPAIRAWKRADPSVVETDIRVPSEGLFIMAAKATPLPDDFWSYEYAVYNMNSHRSAGSFRVPIDPASSIRNIGFHDVHYHSGEPFSGQDWNATVTSVAITWATVPFAQNSNANALRWSTLYNFRFESDAPPQSTTIRLGLFRPGDPEHVDAASIGPATNVDDCNHNSVPDSIDILDGDSHDCNTNGIPDECESYALGAERIATGLTEPIFVATPPGDASRLFIVERGGRIKILPSGGSVLATPFLDLSSDVSTNADQGLLGLAFDPDYELNGRLYVHYTNLSGDSVITRFNESGNPDVADPNSAVVLMTIPQDGPARNGGQLHFGPDGMLYVGLGDGGAGANDPNNRAQDTGSLLGKLLRLDVNNSPTYIPSDNPFVGMSLPLDEIWAMGLGDPRHFSFDRETAELYLVDRGVDSASGIDELNIAPPGIGGQNYAWRCMEGFDCTGLSGCTCNAPALTLPAADFPRSESGCSLIGGYVYRGCDLPQLLGTYLYADGCDDSIHSLRYLDGQITDERTRTAELTPTTGPITSIASFGQDADGELYIVSSTGSIYKIIARDVPADLCGNGVTEHGESCDDGNTQPGDGCDENCQIEPGPANDECAKALATAETTTPFNSAEATTDGPTEPIACNFNGVTQIDNDLWYCYTPSCTGTATVSLCGSDFDTRIAIYGPHPSAQGCPCPTESGAIACNDDACGPQSELSFPVQACDSSYLIRVGGTNGASGPGLLTISCDPDPIANDCNGNGLDDAADIACGTSTDGNANMIPDECETAGDPILGGRLYDRWWAELALDPPTTDHPLWSLRPDPITNQATTATTWRCKECHGWDYKGVDGQYGSGSHHTGFPGILGTTMEASEIFSLLKEPAPNVPNGHDYGSVLSDSQIQELVAFVLSGAIDDAPYIDPQGIFLGDEAQGQSYYVSGGAVPCLLCHGSDGTSINFGTFEEPEYLGTIGVQNPWEMLHKIRFSEPAAPMPSWLAAGGVTQGAADIGRFIQLNFPTECVEDLQCDDGIACTMDTCGSDGRCVFTPTNDLCPQDGIFCNGPEVCDAELGCFSAGNPCTADCDEIDGCGCLPPIVEGAGGRYLAISPQPSGLSIPMRLVVEPVCELNSSQKQPGEWNRDNEQGHDRREPKYRSAGNGEPPAQGGQPAEPVQGNSDKVFFVAAPSGQNNVALIRPTLSEAAELTPIEWGMTVFVTGLEIVPDTEYLVWADCGAAGFSVPTSTTTAKTDLFGDVTGPPPGLPDSNVNFADVSAVVDGFRTLPTAPPLYRTDFFPCLPDQTVNFIDVSGVVDAFRGRTYANASFCPGPCW